MTELAFIHVGGGKLMPANDCDARVAERWKRGDTIRAKVTRMRNGRFHRLFFAMVGELFDMQERYDNDEVFLTVLKIGAGHMETHISPNGKPFYMPKSISFAKCDEDEFRKVYNNVLNYALQNIVTGVTADEVNAKVERLVGFM